MRTEWRRILSILAPEIAARLGLVTILDTDVVIDPDDPMLHEIAACASTARRPPHGEG